MNSLKYIFAFLTTLPIYNSNKINFREPGYALYLFSLVGGVLSLILVLTFLFLKEFIPLTLVSVLLTVFIIVLTGGLHLDGLADTFDGILGGYTPEKRYQIMKDSYIGTFGVLSLIVLVLLKIVLIYEGIKTNNAIIFLLFPIASRAITPAVINFFPIINSDGISSIFKQVINLKTVFTNFIFAIFVFYFFSGLFSIIILCLITVMILFIVKYCNRMLNGINGDIYGAQIEFSEVTYLLFTYIGLSFL